MWVHVCACDEPRFIWFSPITFSASKKECVELKCSHRGDQQLQGMICPANEDDFTGCFTLIFSLSVFFTAVLEWR